jgi:hypothetical protein
MYRPKVVCLDTASWDLLTRKQTCAAQRIFDLFKSGSIIPFLTSTHLDELMQHGDRAVVDSRQAFLRRLPFVAYIQGRYGEGEVGWLLDLCELEMGVLCDSHDGTAESVLEAVRGRVVNRFCSGSELYDQNIDYWEAHRFLEPAFRNTPEVASLAQFTLPDVNLRQKIPGPSDSVTFRTFDEARQLVGGRLDWLVAKLKTDGDPRLKNHERVAAKHLTEILEDLEPLLTSGGDVVGKMLSQFGVERSRLPPSPTIDDVGYETTFIGHLRVHERRLGLPPGTLKQFVSQDQVPSWIVWRETDRAMKRLRKAEASSLADKWMLPFALYIDAFEADKRVCNCVREAETSHPLLKRVQKNLFRRRSVEELDDKLTALAAN